MCKSVSVCEGWSREGKAEKFSQVARGGREREKGAVLPTGINFGRKTQSGPTKISAAGKFRGRILGRFLKMAEKWQNFFELCY
jgi:hypothetical protein